MFMFVYQRAHPIPSHHTPAASTSLTHSYNTHNATPPTHTHKSPPFSTKYCNTNTSHSLLPPPEPARMYHMPPNHAIVLALLLSALFALGFAYWLYRTCSRTVHAEFLVLQEQRARKEGAQAGAPPV